MQGHLGNDSNVAVTHKCMHFAFTPTVVSGKFCPVFPNYRCLVRDDQSPTTRSQGSMFDSLSVIGLLCLV